MNAEQWRFWNGEETPSLMRDGIMTTCHDCEIFMLMIMWMIFFHMTKFFVWKIFHCVGCYVYQWALSLILSLFLLLFVWWPPFSSLRSTNLRTMRLCVKRNHTIFSIFDYVESREEEKKVDFKNKLLFDTMLPYTPRYDFRPPPPTSAAPALSNEYRDASGTMSKNRSN